MSLESLTISDTPSDHRPKKNTLQKLRRFFRSFSEETKSRSCSLPDISFIPVMPYQDHSEDDDEFWNHEPEEPALYQNVPIDCISLNRYRISESDSEVSSDNHSIGSSSRRYKDNIYAVPLSSKRSLESTSSINSAYSEFGLSEHTSYSTQVVLPCVTEEPQYCSQPEDLILPVYRRDSESVSFERVPSIGSGASRDVAKGRGHSSG